MASPTRSLTLILLLNLSSPIVGQAPRRLRANGNHLQTKLNHRRQSLFRVDDIHNRPGDRNREQEKRVLDEEDELLWDRFLQLGSMDQSLPPATPTPPTTPEPTTAPATPFPTSNAETAPPNTIRPTTAPTRAPVTATPTSNANTAPPTSRSPTAAPTRAPVTATPTPAPTLTPVTPAPTPVPATPSPTTTTPNTLSPTRTPGAVPLHCGCFDCTEAAWDTLAGGFTCGERIIFVIGMGSPEVEACRMVAGTEFPDECAPCDPDRCDEDGRDGTVSPAPAAASLATPVPVETPSKTPTPTDGQSIPTAPAPTIAAATPTTTPPPVIPVTRCGCPDCGSAVLDQNAGDFTCLARIDFLISTGESEIDACRLVAGTEFGDVCGPECDPDRCNGPTTPAPSVSPASTPSPKCGCNDCAAAYDLMAGDKTCGDRIDFLMVGGATEEEACRQIASVEYPFLCGPSCDPDKCDGQGPPLQPETPIYCFPEYDDRQRFENMWGDFIVETKEDETLGVCSPSFNKFSRDTVSRNGDELTLRYMKKGDFWEASEVRVVMPQDKMPFQYGTFTWSIKSIKVIDVDTGAERQNYLPPSIIVGMFTWDATEDFTVNENWNHEVDIELGRFGDSTNENDAQFLVQPYTDQTNVYRFSTKETDGDFQQAPQQYSFTWNPGFITWESTAGAGGGTDHFYSSEQAITLGDEDYIQCLPTDLEIRMNLWNLDGALVTPKEMSDNEMVEVVIDNFTYTPTGQTGVEDGGFCTKDCQCLEGSACILGNNRCAPLVATA